MSPDDAPAGAMLSADGAYRYHLWRRMTEGPRLLFVMLNPSTADASVNDPTIRRCIRFAQREGFGRVDVVNLFAFRATNPADLFARLNGGLAITTTENDMIAWAARNTDRTVVAWGAPGARVPDRVQHVLQLLPQRVWCLGMTATTGQPRHPLFVRGDEPLVPFAG